jgi:HEAT repeat protein
VNLQKRTADEARFGNEQRIACAVSVDLRGEVCKALGGVLREGVDIHRCLAARALGRIDHPEAVAALVDALLDEDEDVRTDAAAALARLTPPAAARKLMESLLGDPCTGVKLEAIDALKRMRDPEVVPWLRRLLKGRDEEIAWDDSDFYQDGWDDWVDIQVKAIEGLAELGVEETVPEIVDAIDDEFGQDLSESGFRALARLGAPGIVALAGYLDSDDERRRRRAAAELAATDAEAARPAVERALGDRSKEVRLAAARGLAARNAADHHLVRLFSDEDAAVRAEAVRLCGRHHPDRLDALLRDKAPRVSRAVLELLAEAPGLLPREVLVGPLRAMLGGAAPELAACAAVTLAAAAPAIAVDELVQQLLDEARPLEVRLAAVKGLGRLGGEQPAQALAGVVGDDQRQLRLESMAALAALAASGNAWPNVPGETLQAALRGELLPEPSTEADASSGQRAEDSAGERPAEAPTTAASEQAAGEASIELADEETPGGEADPAAQQPFPQSTLQSMLGDEAPAISSGADGEAIELTQEDLDRLALASRTPKKRVVSVVPEVAPHQDVRRFAARVLGDVPRMEVACELAKALKDGDIELRLAAVDSLARLAERMAPLPPEAVDVLLWTLGDGERDLRLTAIRALGASGGEGTAKVLIGHLRDEDSFVRAETVRALSRLGRVGPEVEALLQGDPDPQVRLAAAGAVTLARGAAAVGLLADFAFAFEGYHRREAGRILRSLDPAAASNRILEVLDNPERRRLWAVAIEVLEELNRTDLSASNGSTSPIGQQEGAKTS